MPGILSFVVCLLLFVVWSTKHDICSSFWPVLEEGAPQLYSPSQATGPPRAYPEHGDLELVWQPSESGWVLEQKKRRRVETMSETNQVQIRFLVFSFFSFFSNCGWTEISQNNGWLLDLTLLYTWSLSRSTKHGILDLFGMWTNQMHILVAGQLHGKEIPTKWFHWIQIHPSEYQTSMWILPP